MKTLILTAALLGATALGAARAKAGELGTTLVFSAPCISVRVSGPSTYCAPAPAVVYAAPRVCYDRPAVYAPRYVYRDRDDCYDRRDRRDFRDRDYRGHDRWDRNDRHDRDDRRDGHSGHRW